VRASILQCVRTLGATLVAVLALVPAAGAGESAAPSLAILLARHTPVLVLHPAERFRPVTVDGFLADSDLMRRVPGGWEKVEGPLPAGSADERLDQRFCRAIDGVAATTCYASAQAAHRAPPVVYGAAFRLGARVVLEYWLWYVFNPYSPTVPPGELWQVHEGDWEAVSVVVDRRGRPLFAAYSQHSAGMRREWARVPKRGTHPLAYVALGSHANYFANISSPTKFAQCVYRNVNRTNLSKARRIVNAVEGGITDRTGSAHELGSAGEMPRLQLIELKNPLPDWARFPGRWSEGEYLWTGRTPTRFTRVSAGAGPATPRWNGAAIPSLWHSEST
jgi:hypothetical protein